MPAEGVDEGDIGMGDDEDWLFADGSGGMDELRSADSVKEGWLSDGDKEPEGDCSVVFDGTTCSLDNKRERVGACGTECVQEKQMAYVDCGMREMEPMTCLDGAREGWVEECRDFVMERGESVLAATGGVLLWRQEALARGGAVRWFTQDGRVASRIVALASYPGLCKG